MEHRRRWVYFLLWHFIFILPAWGQSPLVNWEDQALEAWLKLKPQQANYLCAQTMQTALQEQDLPMAWRALDLLSLIEVPFELPWETWRQQASFDENLQMALDWQMAGQGDRKPLKDWGFCHHFEIVGPFDNRDSRLFETFALTGPGPWLTLEGASSWRRAQTDIWGVLNFKGHVDVSDQVMAVARSRLTLEQDSEVLLTVDSDSDWKLLSKGQEVFREQTSRQFSLDQTRLRWHLPAGTHELYWVVAGKGRGWQFRVRAKAQGKWQWASDFRSNFFSKKIEFPQQITSILPSPWQILDRRRRGWLDKLQVSSQGPLSHRLLSLLAPTRKNSSSIAVLDNHLRRQALQDLLVIYPQTPWIHRELVFQERESFKTPLASSYHLPALEETVEAWLLKGELASLALEFLNHWLDQWVWREDLDQQAFWRQWDLLESGQRITELRFCFEKAQLVWSSEKLYLRALPYLKQEELPLIRQALERHPGWKDLRWALVSRLHQLGESGWELIEKGLELSPFDEKGVLFQVAVFEQKGDNKKAQEILTAMCGRRPGVFSWEKLWKSSQNDQTQPQQKFLQTLTTDEIAYEEPLVRLFESIKVKDLGGGLFRWHETRLHRVLSAENLKDHHDFLISEFHEESVEVIHAEVWRGASRLRARVDHQIYRSGGDTPQGLALIEWPSLKPGDHLFLEFHHVRHRPTFFGDFFSVTHSFRGDWPLLQGVLEIQSSRALNLNSRQTIQKKIGEGHWRFEVSDLPASPREILSPDRFALGPTVEASSFLSWQDFGQWYAALIKNQGQITEAIRQKVKKLTASQKTQQEKIQTLYQFVTDDIRYVTWEFGVHGYKPYTASQIFNNGFGDCKDKALLLKVMLESLNIPSHLVLVNAQESRSSEDFSVPLVNHFNHCVLEVELEEGLLYLDATATGYELALPSMNRGTKGFRVSDEGGELIDMPSLDSLVDELVIRDVLNYQGIQLVQWSAQGEMKGKFAQPWRAWLQAPSHRQQFINHRLTQQWGSAFVSHCEFENMDNLFEPLKSDFQALLMGIIQEDKKEIVLPRSLLQDSLEWIQEKKVSTLRRLPFLIGTPWKWSWETELHFPETFKWIEDSLEVHSSFGDLVWKLSQQEGQWFLKRLIHLKQQQIKPEQMQEFQKFVEQMEEVLLKKLTWS